MRSFLTASVLALATVATAGAPANAQTAASATAIDPAAATKFIDRISSEAFAVLRDKSMTKMAARAKFRGMLRENVALEEIGNRLIRRQRASLTPAQYTAYQAALPEFVLNAYAERLYDYQNATFKMVRTLPRNASVVDVYSSVTQPSTRSFDAIWQVKQMAPGKLMINGLTVEGINLTLTQEADFAAYIQKNGFDKLVEFMKSKNARGAV